MIPVSAREQQAVAIGGHHPRQSKVIHGSQRKSAAISSLT
jgi:hypothetical protein